MHSRSELLFEPDEDCILVGIEDAFTYDKLKLTADDFGLIKITQDYVQMEMTFHKAQFKKEDLDVLIVHTGKNAAGVRMSCNQGPYPWSIVMGVIAFPSGISTKRNPVANTHRLLDIFLEAGIRKREKSTGIAKLSVERIEEPCQDNETVHQSVDENSKENIDLIEARYQNIQKELRKQQKKRKSYLKNIVILLVTLYLFFHLGFFRWGFEFVLLILVVLFVHEMGHFVGMKLFGYKNIQMFFIPLMGAAVSGTSRNIATWKKAVVTLLGPLPGIVISFILFIIYVINGKELYFQFGVMFLVLNVLNLLPIFPLDGGRFLHEVLFSRNRFFELTMNILASSILLIAGFGLGDWVLKFLGFLNLLTLQYKFKISSAAQHMRRDLLLKENSQLEILPEGSIEEEIPEDFLKKMIDWIYQNMPGPLKPKVAAMTVVQMWERIRVRPPKIGATILLLFFFVMGYIFSFVSLGALAVGYYQNNLYKSEIAEYKDADGTTRFKEQWYYMGKLETETQLSDDQEYYHGSHKVYDDDDDDDDGKLVEQGQWNMGRRTGEWKYYDPNGFLIEEELYEDGKLILIRSLEEGEWAVYRWKDFSKQEKEYYIYEAEIQQGPEKTPTFDYPEFTYDVNNVEEPCSVKLL
jgi:Zn-dependent protease